MLVLVDVIFVVSLNDNYNLQINPDLKSFLNVIIMMKKLVQFIVLLFIAFSFSSCGYNSMVALDEEVNSAWAQVENAYKRRADLIGNLVSTVKGYAEHEAGTFEQVVSARARATSVTVDPTNLTPEAIKQFQEAQKSLGGALSRLLMTVENYPDLKANANFLALQKQLEGTENRISVERQKFNETVKEYNSYVRSFPSNIMAGIFGFGRKAYFEAEPSAQDVPDVGKMLDK